MKISASSGHMLAMGTVLLWGITFISTKILLVGLSPAEILVLRFAIGYLALWLIRPKILRTSGWREEALFAAAGAPTDPSQIGVSREQLRSMVDFTQLLRWRINLLDLAKRARIYDELVARVFGKGGAWEIP